MVNTRSSKMKKEEELAAASHEMKYYFEKLIETKVCGGAI